MSAPEVYMAGFPWVRVQRDSLIVGVVALTLSAAAAVWNPAQFFHSYLFAFLFWAGIPLGCLAVLMLQHLTGGGWGIVIRRVLESGARTLPLVAVLFVPVLIGLRWIFKWARGMPLRPPQNIYFVSSFFALRAAGYFLIWIALSVLLSRWSRQQDTSGDGRALRRLRALSGPGLILYGLTATFASVDWIMSLEPGWYSTIIGMLYISGQILSALSFAVVALFVLSEYSPLGDVLKPRHWHDLGKLLLTFVMLWAYMAFSQLLIIWAENLPDETPYYLERLRGGWLWIAVALVVFHFAIPFFLLLSRELKRSGRALAMLATFIIAMRGVDLFWYTTPAFYPGTFHIHWMDLVAPIGVGGIWLSHFSWQLRRFPLLPQGDPHLAEGLKDTHE